MSHGPLAGDEVLPPLEAVQESARHRSDVSWPLSGSRWQQLNSFIDATMKELIRSDAFVWLVLYRDTRDGIAKTSQGSIAARTGFCRRTVTRAINRLEKRGLLEIVRHGGLNRGTNHYRLRPRS